MKITPAAYDGSTLNRIGGAPGDVARGHIVIVREVRNDKYLGISTAILRMGPADVFLVCAAPTAAAMLARSIGSNSIGGEDQ